MTEAEWLASETPEPMLKLLEGKASERKLRLFAVACCRAIWDLMDDPRSRNVLDRIQEYVDGLIPPDVMHAAHESAADAAGDGQRDYHFRNEYPSSAAKYASDTLAHGFWDVEHVVGVCAADAQWACAVAGVVGGKPDPDPITTARAIQSGFARDIFGNPFRPVAADPAWLTSDVVALARGIYEDRAFERLPILADALQDAGCGDEQILAHCRDPQAAHVRGCWIIDLVLGKG